MAEPYFWYTRRGNDAPIFHYPAVPPGVYQVLAQVWTQPCEDQPPWRPFDCYPVELQYQDQGTVACRTSPSSSGLERWPLSVGHVLLFPPPRPAAAGPPVDRKRPPSPGRHHRVCVRPCRPLHHPL